MRWDNTVKYNAAGAWKAATTRAGRLDEPVSGGAPEHPVGVPSAGPAPVSASLRQNPIMPAVAWQEKR